MIRVAVILAAFAQLSAVALAEVPKGTSSKRVTDSYYLKRQETKAAVAVSSDDEEEADALATPARPAGYVPTQPSPYRAAQMPMNPQALQNAPAMNHYANPQLAQYATEGETYTDDSEMSSGQEEYVDGDCEDGSCEGGDEECDTLGVGCFMAAVQAVPTENVLWHEIYSCRSMWADLDYLGFWVKGNHVPPLVTTSPIGTPQTEAGVLGAPGTTILFGDQRLDTSMRSGGRITLGAWLVGDVIAVEGNYFALGTANTTYNQTSIFSNGSTSDPILARPFFDPTLNGGTGAQHQLLVAYPNFNAGGTLIDLDGSVNVHSASSIQSAGLGLKRLVGVDLLHDHRMFLVGGYRFFRLDEGLEIEDVIRPVGGPYLPGASLTHFDSFGTKNIFNGGDVGLFSDLRRGRWVLESTGKIAFGNMYEVVNINGNTRVNNGATATDYAGGLLTQVSNIGVYRRNQFAMIPELNVKLGLQITGGLRATVGYNFQYVTRVARPGNEIDFTVAVPPTPGAPQPVARPTYLNNPTDLWLQGFTAGLEYRW